MNLDEMSHIEQLAARAQLIGDLRAAINRLTKRAISAEAECAALRAKAERYLLIISRIHGLLVSDHIVLPDGRIFEFNNPAIEHQMLFELSKAIRTITIDTARASEEIGK